MANSADPDQLASSEANWSDLDLHCLQIQAISAFSRQGLVLNRNIFLPAYMSTNDFYLGLLHANLVHNKSRFRMVHPK